MKTHDPSECIKGLQQLLVSDKKRIAFLFGAGTSLAKKNDKSPFVPAIGRMTQDIVSVLSKNPSYATAIDEIRQELDGHFTIETLLSNLEQKKKIIGSEILNGLDKKGFEDLCKNIKTEIHKIVSIHEKVTNVEDIIHSDFASWIKRAERQYPIEIFTTNYDYLFEMGLEAHNIPYYDGFTGSFKPFFNADSIEDMSFLPKQTKLWKIHGSLGWHHDPEKKKVWRKDSSEEDILIYPSSLKYDESKKQPYTALTDRLTNFLKQKDSVLITCGYSFGDEHINERILTGLKSNPLVHVFVLYYDIYYEKEIKKYSFTKDCALSKIALSNRKLSVYGTKNAVIGGKYLEWKFNENDSIEHGEREDLKEAGELRISDFKYLVKFLQSMMYDNNLMIDNEK